MTDEELIGKTLAGDRNAFGELVIRYQAMVYATCLRLSGSVPDAEDLTHDALVDGFLKLSQLKDPQRFGGWLKTLTLNVFRMWYRKRQRDVEPDEEVCVPEEEPEDESLRKRIAGCLFRLSPVHRVVLVLHYLEQLSYGEIADFLGVPMGTVMSRLKRGRDALRVFVKDQTREGIGMAEIDSIKQDVMTEITVLLELFRDQPEAAERLSVILEKSPERLVQLFDHTEDGDISRSVGKLLPRLGNKAVCIALDASFAATKRTAANGCIALRASIPDTQAAKQRPFGGWCERYAYELCDLIIRHPASSPSKVGLLISLLEAVQERVTAALFECVLMAYGQTAFVQLERWYQSTTGVDDLFGNKYVLSALCRTGDNFCRVLLRDLKGPDTQGRWIRALWALEAMARTIDRHWLLSSAQPSEGKGAMVIAQEMRRRPVVWSTDLDPGVLSALLDQLVVFTTHHDASIRDHAVETLGTLRAGAHAGVVRSLLTHGNMATRIMAVRTLSEMADGESAERLIESARMAGDPRERIAAIEAIGRMGLVQARTVLMRLADDPLDTIQAAAVVALGGLNDPALISSITALGITGSKARRRAAAKVLHRMEADRPKPPPTPAQNLLWKKLHGEDSCVVAHVSIDAALRLGLPELRSYNEQEITRAIARVVYDFSYVRRLLIEEGLMTRNNGIYEFTAAGAAAWRVEHFILDNYLALSGRTS